MADGGKLNVKFKEPEEDDHDANEDEEDEVRFFDCLSHKSLSLLSHH